MNTKIYFENLPATVTEGELMELFSAHGNVANIHIVADRTTNVSRGCGFVTMITPEAARAAIQSIGDRSFGKGTIVLSEASPTEEAVDSKNGRTNPRRMMSRLF
jgi:RNA recognition motif-containing protein